MRFDDNWTASFTVTIFSAASSGISHAEFFFEGHDQLDGVEAVGAQIVDEAGIVGDLGLVDAQVLHDDFLYPLGDITHHSFLGKIDAQIMAVGDIRMLGDGRQREGRG